MTNKHSLFVLQRHIQNNPIGLNLIDNYFNDYRVHDFRKNTFLNNDLFEDNFFDNDYYFYKYHEFDDKNKLIAKQFAIDYEKLWEFKIPSFDYFANILVHHLPLSFVKIATQNKNYLTYLTNEMMLAIKNNTNIFLSNDVSWRFCSTCVKNYKNKENFSNCN